ncbi:hypothetical protein D3C81_1853120 [compost metagenome]
MGEGERRNQRGYHHVLPEGYLQGIHVRRIAAVGYGQHGERQARAQAPDQAKGAAVEQVEGRHHHHQARSHHQQQQALHGTDALAEHAAFDHGYKGREAGEAQGGHGHAADLDGDEEGHPVRRQQRAG